MINRTGTLKSSWKFPENGIIHFERSVTEHEWTKIKADVQEAAEFRGALMLRAVGSSSEFISLDRTKCAYCRQYGEPRTACEYCGAPVD
jgi:hypothetical protein